MPRTGRWHYYGTLVDALLTLGRRDEAVRIARAWLERTTAFGAKTTIGMAQRAVAMTESGDAQIDGLRQAVQTLAASPSKFEHARAQIDLGAALRRAGQRTEAREYLRLGLDTSTRIGARPLADRASDELAASGARLRRALLTGVDALSPSERRVVQLVASGMSNREVADALFISRKTVEKHLGSAYLKLGTNERDKLGELVGEGGWGT